MSATATAFFDSELIGAVRRWYLPLLFGPLLATIATYAIDPNLPGLYTSAAYLRLDTAAAQSLSLWINPWFGGRAPERDQLAAANARMHHHMSLLAIDAKDNMKPALFRLEMVDREPAVAQSINRSMLGQWLATAAPPVGPGVVIAGPDLPGEKSGSGRTAVAVFTGITVIPLLLILAMVEPVVRRHRVAGQ
jgi:hypothetical protein